jgi:hypothetical protein
MKPKKLGLHSEIMAALKTMAEVDELEGHRERLEDLEGSIVFDCRKLPEQFVDDTGEAAFEEAEQTKQTIRLPFDRCYFEFADEVGICAHEVGHNTGPYTDDGGYTHLGEMVEFVDYRDWGKWPEWHDPGAEESRLVLEFKYMGRRDPPFGCFPNGITFTGEEDDHPRFYEPVNTVDWEDGRLLHAAKRLIGVLTLLNEHLLATEVRPDPSPDLTRARLRRGRTPLSSETRVLTINVAAARRAVAESTGRLLKHEPPSLHWRRGHWRTLHRGSEFEGKTWVRRCLVGDPDRGFIHRDYKLLWRQPVVQPTPVG